MLHNIIDGENYYDNLIKIFLLADRRYNSGLFDFSTSRKDTISETVVIDNKIIKSIIKDLYYPKSSYEFSVLPVEILGSAYEQFLGKTITLDKNHKAKIEYKEDVRKAGGVYYTPEYIVKYIVLNTVGELIKNKTPKQIEAVKIVDPACGSGSFLLGAYSYLLEYNENYYLNNPPSAGKKESPIGDDNKLTVQAKKRILVNNIFGVDIDAQAVEVSKLSLLLKCLEGESEASISDNMSLFGERALPSMDDNVKCGNSLIGSDFYNSSNEFDFGDNEAIYKINAFDWQTEFSSVFKSGGFDVVLGNPPYVRIHLLDKNHIEYFKNKFISCKGQIDLYTLFIEQAISNLVKENGKVSFITPRFLKFNIDSECIRELLLKYSIDKLIEVGQVFKDVSTECMIFVFTKNENNTIEVFDYYPHKELQHIKAMNKEDFYNFPNKIFNTLVTKEELNIINRILGKSKQLNAIGNVKRGMEIGKKDKKKMKME